MKPIIKIHTCVFAITTSILFYLGNFLVGYNINNKLLKLLITFIFSTTFYKIIYNFLLLLFSNFRQIRKLFLGKFYVEGAWIGFYICDGVPELFYEIFEQTIEHITIKGYGYDLTGNYICNWTILNPFIDIEESKIAYYYEANEKLQKDIIIGFARGTIEWSKSNIACKIIGFAFDGVSMENQPFLSVKLNDHAIQDKEFLLPPNMFDQIYRIYEKNIKYFN